MLFSLLLSVAFAAPAELPTCTEEVLDRIIQENVGEIDNQEIGLMYRCRVREASLKRLVAQDETEQISLDDIQLDDTPAITKKKRRISK